MENEIRRQLDVLERALAGDRGEDQQRIALAGLDWLCGSNGLLPKNIDYGSSVWKRPVLAPDCSIGESIFVRMSDKVSRIATLRNGQDPEIVSESLDDCLKDLASYALLYLARPGDAE